MGRNGNQETAENRAQEQDVSKLAQVRREKLEALQAEGKDPFVIVKYDQTEHTAQIRDNCFTAYYILPEQEFSEELMRQKADRFADALKLGLNTLSHT